MKPNSPPPPVLACSAGLQHVRGLPACTCQGIEDTELFSNESDLEGRSEKRIYGSGHPFESMAYSKLAPFKQGASKLTSSSHTIRKRIYIALCIFVSNVDITVILYPTCCHILPQDDMRKQQGWSASWLHKNSSFIIIPTGLKRHDWNLPYMPYVRHRHQT